MKNLVKICLSIFILFTVMSLTSCSDNGGDGPDSSDPANGIWSGTIDETEITAYLYDGRIIIFGGGFGGFDGTYIISSQDISADGNWYTYVHDNPPRNPAVLSGTILARDSISATLSDSVGKTGSITLKYDADLYNRSSSVSLLVGSWKIPGLTIMIEDNGSFSGRFSPGCMAEGNINILDSSHNLYNVEFTVDCGHSHPGRVTGFSALLDSDTIQVAASNPYYLYDYRWLRLHEATELEGRWGREEVEKKDSWKERYAFSGNRYEFSRSTTYFKICSTCPEEHTEYLNESGKFEIGDAFTTSSGVEANKIIFTKVDGNCKKACPETMKAYTIVQDNDLHIWGEDTTPGNEITYLPFRKKAQEKTFSIGDTGPAGGIVFYVTDGGLHGLEAAPQDQARDVAWGCSGTEIAGADGFIIGTGGQNTAEILADCPDAGIAARRASNYELNGYKDWFLPSKDELNELMRQQYIVGSFTYDYWSSTEDDRHTAWIHESGAGNSIQIRANKGLGMNVRAIRSF